jgi:predicted AlkP superfamily pyrophosphatase or phosphodiesterase
MKRTSAAAIAGLGAICVVALLLLLVARQPAPVPKLTVLIVVDQMRYDYLERFDKLYQGGFRTLLDKGAVFTNARFRHALTLTANGHSVVATGLHPSSNGMAANNWYDPARGSGVNCVFDPRESTIGGPGPPVSPRTLLADTLADRLKQKYETARVVSLSTKDRGAILLAGRKADGVYWFSVECGCFVSSSYYTDRLPHWLAAFNASKPADRFAGTAWTRLRDDPALYEKHSREDAFPQEYDGERITFPHTLRGAPPQTEFYSDLTQSAFADEMLVQAALAALDGHQLGRDEVPDLLAVSLSGTDYVGHTYGPFSQEAMDQHLRLDLLLQKLFQELDEKVGWDQTLVVLTADHGAAPIVEFLQRQGKPAKRLPRDALVKAVNQAVAERFPKLDNVIVFEESPHLYLDLARIEKLGIERATVEQIAREGLMATGYIEAVYTHSDLQEKPAGADEFWQLYKNSLFEQRSPHLMLRLKEYFYLDGSQGATGHGTPYDYDRHVPVIFYGKGITAGLRERDCGPDDIASTLGRILQVEMPIEPDGRVLEEVLH